MEISSIALCFSVQIFVTCCNTGSSPVRSFQNTCFVDDLCVFFETEVVSLAKDESLYDRRGLFQPELDSAAF